MAGYLGGGRSSLSRRATLRAIGGGTFGSMLASGLFGAPAFVQAQADQPSAPPASDAQAPPTTQCIMPFSATIRQGPRSGTEFSGILTLPIGPSGSIDEGVFTLADGSTIPVVGQATGRALSLVFDMGDGTFIFGSGAGQYDIRFCTGAMGGPFVGPQPGEAGEWLGTAADTVMDAVGNIYTAFPTDDVIYIKSLTGGASVFAGAVGVPGLVDGARLSARFSGPSGLSFNSSGGLLVGDHGNQAVRRINLSTGQVTTRVTRSLAVAAGVSTFGVWGVGQDNLGNLFISDNVNQVVWYYTTASNSLKVLAGAIGKAGLVDGIGSAARFNNPQSIAMSDDGTICNLRDVGNTKVRQIAQNGQVETIGP